MEFSGFEARVLYEATGDELRKCINEYDDDTNRRPGKKRITDSKYARSIIEKLESKQPKIQGTDFVNLDGIKGCSLKLDGQEMAYLKALLLKNIADNHVYLAKQNKPYSGANQQIAEWTDTAESIVERINKSKETEG